MKSSLFQIPDPQDYFKGIGSNRLPTPLNILLFVRNSKSALQQRAPRHLSHHRCVLIVNLKTEGLVHLDNLTLPFPPRHALTVMPYQFHHYTNLQHPSLQWLFCTFELDSTAFLEPLRNRVISIGNRSEQFVRALLESRRRASPESMQAALLQLLISLKTDQKLYTDEAVHEPAESLLRTINRFMMEKPETGITQLAEEIGLSESRLRARFHNIAGIPLGRYIRNYRINCSMSLLRRTSLPIAEVAEQSGFSSQQAFNRTFKNHTGQTPRTYRRQ